MRAFGDAFAGLYSGVARIMAPTLPSDRGPCERVWRACPVQVVLSNASVAAQSCRGSATSRTAGIFGNRLARGVDEMNSPVRVANAGSVAGRTRTRAPCSGRRTKGVRDTKPAQGIAAEVHVRMFALPGSSGMGPKVRASLPLAVFCAGVAVAWSREAGRRGRSRPHE